VLGRTATPESLQTLREQLHLNKSVFEQYVDWLGGVLTGDPGESLAAREPVTNLIGKSLENSAFLVLIAALISVPLSIFLGAVTARRRAGPFAPTTALMTLAMAAVA